MKKSTPVKATGRAGKPRTQLDALLPLHLHVILDAISHRLVVGVATSIHPKHYKFVLDQVTAELARQEKQFPDYALRHGLLMNIPKRNWRPRPKPATRTRKRRTHK